MVVKCSSDFPPDCGSKNPATLLPESDPDQVLHGCGEVLTTLTSLRPDLTGIPLIDAEATLYTDGSSFVEGRVRYAGAAVVSQDKVIWAQALGHGTSAQRTELIPLTQALWLGRGKKINVYTDSRYIFATIHVHGALYKERGLRPTGGRDIKNAAEILDLLASIWGPVSVAIMHCRGHHKDNSDIARGNRFADQSACEAAKTPVGPIQILSVCEAEASLPQSPHYSQEELEVSKKLGGKEGEKGWIRLPDN